MRVIGTRRSGLVHCKFTGSEHLYVSLGYSKWALCQQGNLERLYNNYTMGCLNKTCTGGGNPTLVYGWLYCLPIQRARSRVQERQGFALGIHRLPHKYSTVAPQIRQTKLLPQLSPDTEEHRGLNLHTSMAVQEAKGPIALCDPFPSCS